MLVIMFYMAKDSILLIHVGNFWDENPMKIVPSPPLGIVYLGSYLISRGYQVIFLDSRLKERKAFFPELEKALPQARLAGLSVMTPLTKEGLEITRFIKKFDRSLPVVWGGFHATLFPESTLQNELIDFIIVNEGEKGLLGLADFLFQKRDIADIPNLSYKNNGAITRNRFEPGEDLRTIGIPSYAHFDFRNYLGPADFTKTIKIDILTSRGCHACCAFCVNSIIHKSKWRPEPISQTMQNIDTALRAYKTGHICFVDEDFFADLERIKAIVLELTKKNVTWDANCRADYIRDGYLDDKALDMLYASGCRGLRFGLESGSQRMLDLLNKQITVAQSLHALEKIHRHHISASVSFMMGVPDEKPQDVIMTFDLILEIFRRYPEIDVIGPWMFRPYPGSVLFNRCVERGLAIPASLNEWTNFSMPDFPVYKKSIYPWLSESELTFLRRAGLCRAYLKKEKAYVPRWLRYLIVKFHMQTGCKFIDIDHTVFRCLKGFLGFFRRDKP